MSRPQVQKVITPVVRKRRPARGKANADDVAAAGGGLGPTNRTNADDAAADDNDSASAGAAEDSLDADAATQGHGTEELGANADDAAAQLSDFGDESADDAATEGDDENADDESWLSAAERAATRSDDRETSVDDAATDDDVRPDDDDETSADDAATPNVADEASADDAATGGTTTRSWDVPTRPGIRKPSAAGDAATHEDRSRPSDVVELNGQRLRRVSPRQLALQKRREAKPPPPAAPEEDDIVIGEPRVNARGELPDESGPEDRREGVTVSEIEAADGLEFPDTAGRGPPRTLTDVFAAYPIGNGLHYVRVERLKPEMYLGVPCAGYMGDLNRPMTEGEFRLFYGGGRYELCVYGPDPRGRADPITGQPIIKALTKPITVRVPGNPTSETLAGDLTPGKRTGMFPPSPFEGGRRGPPATTADASIHRDSLHLAQNLIQEERREKNELRRELQQGATKTVEPIVEAVRGTAKEGMDLLRSELDRTRAAADREILRYQEEIRALRADIEAVRRQPTSEQGAWSALSQVAQSLAPGRSSNEEIARLHESHRDEVRRLEEQHRRELADMRAGFDDRVKLLQNQIESERSRAREEVRDVTDRLERREKDARDAFEQRLKDQREHYEQRERDNEARQRGELDRMRAEHERELRSQAQQHELIRTTDKQGHEARIAQMKDRNEILKEEVDRWKTEANNKADWAEQMTDFERKAEALGFQKADANAPQTWQDRVAMAFGDALRNADKIAGNIAGALRERKETAIAQADLVTRVAAQQAQQAQQGGPGALPPHQGQPQQPQRQIRGPGGRPVTTARSVWASDDLSMAPPAGATGTPVVHPDARSEAPAQPVHGPQAPVAPPAAAPAPPNQPLVGPPAAPPQQPQQPAQAPQAQAAAPPQQGFPIDPQMLDSFRMWAESQIDAKRDPEEFGRDFVDRVGAQQAAEVVFRLPVEALFEALSSTPEMLGSPILRRDGQAFMRKAWNEAQRHCRKSLGIPEPE